MNDAPRRRLGLAPRLALLGGGAIALWYAAQVPQEQTLVVELPAPELAAGAISSLSMTWAPSDAPDKREAYGGTTWRFPNGAPKTVRTRFELPDGQYWFTFRWTLEGPGGETHQEDAQALSLSGDSIRVFLRPSRRAP